MHIYIHVYIYIYIHIYIYITKDLTDFVFISYSCPNSDDILVLFSPGVL